MAEKLPTTAIGANIKAAREAKRWSQGDLSSSLRVSVQAISQWETGKTLPSLDNIMAAAALLSVHPGVLLWGEAFVSEAVASQHYWPRVPIIWWDAVPKIDIDSDSWKSAIKGRISGYITPTSRRMAGEFALQVDDFSMVPEFRQGDHLLIEFAHSSPLPGDYVIAVVPPDFSNVNPHAILRKLQIQYEGKKVIYRLVPANEDFPIVEIRGPKDGYIAGVVVEQRRYHKTIEQILGMSDEDLDREERDAENPIATIK
jgi:transcriptional regulator with XRE-family HTH domain